MNRSILLIFGLLYSASLLAQTTGSPFIRLDQFGYLPQSKKVAILADPIVGFDAAESYTPGNTFEVRRTSDQQTVFSGALVAWKNGATHTQSGDRGWWFDFSALSTPGEYYLYDVDQQIASHPFRIGANVYQEVLKQAVRTYYYQRLNMAKAVPFTDPKWADAISFEGQNQDRAARSRWAKNDPSTARDVHGGWMDAGDVNKYTTFAESAVLQLLEAYRRNPAVFGDDFGIPESGNGIPDLLDELRWELDFLKRMQDATGTNGFFLKVGVDNFDDVSPISADTRPRYYLPECTSATLAGCAMFAQAAVVFSNNSNTSLQDYGAGLMARAELAWERVAVTTANFSQFQTDCDDGDIKAGDADRSVAAQLESAIVAAVYLFESSGKSLYHNFILQHFNAVKPMSENWWGPYQAIVQNALLRYSTFPNANASVANIIRSQKANMNYAFSIDSYQAQTDLYRAQMDDWAHHWGSNMVRSNCGNLNMDFVAFNINPAQATQYREVAAEYLHWLHGSNALGMVMLSNMYAYGGDACANEIYHTWFGNNTPYDNALTSPKGPAPGYLTGGPNKDFSYAPLSPPANQPVQKSYLDYNDGWPESSWEITEPAIYYNAGYILLLSNFVENAPVSGSYAPGNAETALFELFPNPASDLVMIRFDSPGIHHIRVLDRTGRLVLEQKSQGLACWLHMRVYPAGIYQVWVDGVVRVLVKGL